MAEWLRRWTANPMCSARVGSNPILVEKIFFRFILKTFFLRKDLIKEHMLNLFPFIISINKLGAILSIGTQLFVVYQAVCQ